MSNLPQTTPTLGIPAGGAAPAPVHEPSFPVPAAAPPERTLIDILQDTAGSFPDASALDDGHAVTQLRPAHGMPSGQRRGSCTRPAWAPETGSASGSRPAPTSCTSRSWRSCWSGRPTCRSTPTTRTSGPSWSSARPGSPAIAGAGGEIVTAAGSAPAVPHRRPPGPERRRLGHLHLGLHRSPRASPSRTARRRPSSTPRRGCSSATSPSGPQDRVLAGLSVAFDASCEEMWLAWRHGACLVPGAAGAGPHRRWTSARG